MARMSDATLTSICEAKLANALGWVGGRLSKERTQALDYYRGDAFGNEQDGRSKVVSRDVAEAVDGAMPSIIKVFASVDTVVSCQPRRKDSEETAKQATDYLNWVFQNQPNSFDILQTWIKDALLSKLGVVKSWWDESEEVTTEEYEGLTRNQYHTLLLDDEITPISVKTYAPGKQELAPGESDEGTEDDEPEKPAMSPQPDMPPPQGGPGQLPQTPANFPGTAPLQGGPVGTAAPGGSPGMGANPPGAPAGAITQPPSDDGMLYDCKLKRTHKNGRVMIETIPNEEFLTERRAISLDKSAFCAHRSKRTVSDVIEMGVSKADAQSLPGGTELDYNTEVLNRFKAEDENPQRDDTDSLDPALRPVWVAECYLKVDYNGDGVAEWRKVTLAGSGGYKILFNEECDGHPFSAWTPFKQPHKLYGESMADKTMDLQLIKSTIWRQTLDGMYFNNAPQLVVIEGQANMEDVLTRRPGGVIRAKSVGAVEPLPVQDSSQSGMSMLGYLDQVRESRTGIRRWTPGLEGNEINPLASTATGVSAVEDASQDTLDLICRNFAEQALKPLFKRLLELTCKHQQKMETIRLRGKWVDIDPSTWDSEMDMQVMVGLGTGDKSKQAQNALTMLTQITAPVVSLQGGLSGPMVTADNVYAQIIKYVEAIGMKSTDGLFTNPKEAPPAPPKPPDPKMVEVQGKLQLAQQQGQQKLQLQQQSAQQQAQLEQEKAARQASTEQQQAHADMATAQQKAQLEAQLEQRRAEHQAQLDQMEMMHKIALEQLKVRAQIAVQQVKTQADIEHKRAIAKVQMSKPKPRATT